jgi:hypothetical protein
MAPELTYALIGFGGAILGGLIQSIFSYQQAHARFVRDSRQRDYNLFVEAIAGMSQAVANSKERQQFVAKAIEAKGKIILNSSSTVLEAMVAYSKHSALASEKSYSDFAKLLAAMRADIGGEVADSLEAQVRAILFEGSKK